jgi:hypothetical protein
MMKIEEKRKKAASLARKRARLLAENSRLAKQQASLDDEVANHDNSKRFSKGITAKAVMGMDYRGLRGDWYRKVDNWFFSLAGIRHGGYNTETGQAYVSVCLDKGKPLDAQLGILQFVPEVKPMKDGKKHLGIFESTLSEHGVWSLAVSPDDSVELELTRYGRKSIEGTFKSVMEALEYVHKHRYYEDSSKKRDDVDKDDDEAD